MSLQQKIDRITDILRRDDGISGAMHYTEQTSWILFLKFLDDYEAEKADEAILSGVAYTPVLDEQHRWGSWACPKTADGRPDIQRARTGDDLRGYVNGELFPYLKAFRNTTGSIVGADPNSFRYKIGAIFEYLDNKIASGHTLREVLDIIDGLNFQSESELFELSQVYEGLLQNMGDAGGYAGEFYTPRPLIRSIVKVIDPKPGQTVYDAAAGSCGFLIQAFEHLKGRRAKLSTSQWDQIQQRTFYGYEKTTLAYVMGMMNMILHGIESPNLYRQNTLTQNIRDIQEKDRYDIILANPPFGGKEKAQIQQNFPIQSNATELLFLQHFMKSLKIGGKAAIVVPEGVLFQTNSAFTQVKQELLEHFNLHTILSLPAGVFLPYSGVKTNVLFFERRGGTTEIWFYECEPEQKLTKNKPLTDAYLAEFVELYAKRSTTDRSWTMPVDKLKEDYDLSAKNPAKQNDVEHLPPRKILELIQEKETAVTNLLGEIDELLGER
jgi:type I restriction enzyme M protein